jgi:hypothetical protein
MLIYTGQTGTITKFEKIKRLGMGICLSSNPNSSPSKDMSEVPCFLDNGAFACHSKGYPFQEDVFMTTMKKAYKCNIPLDFIVVPDLLMRGKDSLEFSMGWIHGALKTANNLALVVQDGMLPKHLDEWDVPKQVTYIFIGGSVDWKWETADMWREYSHKRELKLHIGQVGTLKNLKVADRIGADSVDSTSYTRNDTFETIEQFKLWKEGYAEELV